MATQESILSSMKLATGGSQSTDARMRETTDGTWSQNESSLNSPAAS